MPAAEVVGKWKSQGDFQGGLGRRLFHNLILPPGPTPEAILLLGRISGDHAWPDWGDH